MNRFKEKIRNNLEWLPDQVWQSEHITGDSMTSSQFRKWAKKNPNMFSFLDELQVTLAKALHRQKITSATIIQRAYRAKLRYRHHHLGFGHSIKPAADPTHPPPS